MLYFRPSSRSFSSNNIDYGGRRFTVFIVDKSTRFRQVCQLLLSLIEATTFQYLVSLIDVYVKIQLSWQKTL